MFLVRGVSGRRFEVGGGRCEYEKSFLVIIICKGFEFCLGLLVYRYDF